MKTLAILARMGGAGKSTVALVLAALALGGCQDALCRRPTATAPRPAPTPAIKYALENATACLQKQVAHLVTKGTPAREIAGLAVLGCGDRFEDLNVAHRAAGPADDIRFPSGLTITETRYGEDDFRDDAQRMVDVTIGRKCWWPPKRPAKARVVEVLD